MLPTSKKSFPDAVVYALVTAMLSLTSYHAVVVKDCEEERKDIDAKHRQETAEYKNEVKDLNRRFMRYMEVQDSINRVKDKTLKNIKR